MFLIGELEVHYTKLYLDEIQGAYFTTDNPTSDKKNKKHKV